MPGRETGACQRPAHQRLPHLHDQEDTGPPAGPAAGRGCLLTRAGHVPAQDKIRQLQALGAHLYACAPSMRHFKVATSDLAFADVTVAEYLTFMETMAHADIQPFVQ